MRLTGRKTPRKRLPRAASSSGAFPWGRRLPGSCQRGRRETCGKQTFDADKYTRSTGRCSFFLFFLFYGRIVFCLEFYFLACFVFFPSGFGCFFFVGFFFLKANFSTTLDALSSVGERCRAGANSFLLVLLENF